MLHAGFPIVMQYYTYRIRDLLLQMSALEEQVLPSNRDFVDQFMGSVTLRRVDALLAGAYNAKTNIDWDEELFDKFQRYVVDQEVQLRKTLQTIKYAVDTPSTLILLLGSSRLEKASFVNSVSSSIISQSIIAFASPHVHYARTISQNPRHGLPSSPSLSRACNGVFVPFRHTRSYFGANGHNQRSVYLAVWVLLNSQCN